MGIFSVFPLLTIPVVVYNLMAFVFNKGPDLVAGEAATTAPALASTLAAPIKLPFQWYPALAGPWMAATF